MPQLICLHLQKPGAERFLFLVAVWLVEGKTFSSVSYWFCYTVYSLSDLKDEVFNQAEKVSKQEKEYKSTVDKIKQLEEKEKAIRQNLALINDLKRAMIYRHLKSK